MQDGEWREGLSSRKIKRVERYVRKTQAFLKFANGIDLENSEIANMRKESSPQILNIGLIFPTIIILCAAGALSIWGDPLSGVLVYLIIINVVFGGFFYYSTCPALSPNRLLVNSSMESIPVRYRDYAKFLKNRSRFLSVSNYEFNAFLSKNPADADYNKDVSIPVEKVRSKSQWDSSFSIFDSVYNEWFNVESDIVKVVQYPLYTNMREKVTRDFHSKMAYAIQLEPEKWHAYTPDHPFIKAVIDMEIAWKALKSQALRAQDKSYSEEEHKRLKTARNMLNIAFNKASTQSERQIAYRRAMKELDGLINVPQQAILTIEIVSGIKEIQA